MEIDSAGEITDGWLGGVDRCESPNCDERPFGEVSLLVIHSISLPPGQFGTGCVEAFFTNQLDCGAHPFFQEIEGVTVSAHLLIERCGRVVQFVSFNRRAWHAGVSVFEQRERCNDFSIGIELEGADQTPYTDAQYQQLQSITRLLMGRYPQITAERIVGHCDIAPGRKTDPGEAFDWQRYRSALVIN